MVQQALNLSNCDRLRQAPSPQVAASLAAVFSRNTLDTLSLDGCRLDPIMLSSMAQCSGLRHLSLVGCASLHDAPLRAVLDACDRLQYLGLGGAALTWHEGRVLPGSTAVKHVRELALYRRTNLTDSVSGSIWCC